MGDVFDLPVPIVIDYADGRSESVDVLAREPVNETRIPLQSPIRRVHVDRELTLARW